MKGQATMRYPSIPPDRSFYRPDPDAPDTDLGEGYRLRRDYQPGDDPESVTDDRMPPLWTGYLGRWAVIMAGTLVLVAMTLCGVRNLWLQVALGFALIWLAVRMGGRR